MCCDGMTMARWGERILFIGGLALLGFCALAYLHGVLSSRLAIETFEADRKQAPRAAAAFSPSVPPPLDFTLWSEKRLRLYRTPLAKYFDNPLAVLRIRRLRLEAPVFEGTDDLTLNRGVGTVVGSALPGEVGNMSIAGHRDSFFRRLKDAVVGDSVELSTITGTYTYKVDSLRVVFPDDVGVLRHGTAQSLTLVTCYPFYFVGNAPRRSLFTHR